LDEKSLTDRLASADYHFSEEAGQVSVTHF
jgi:hypothetical protein